MYAAFTTLSRIRQMRRCNSPPKNLFLQASPPAAALGLPIPMSSAQTTAILEPDIHRIGREILARARTARPAPFELGWWQDRGMAWANQHQHLREGLFRFISLLPKQRASADVARVLRENVTANGDDLPFPLALAVDFVDDHSLHARLVARAARFAAERMAHSFIVGSTPPEAVAAVTRMRRRNMCFTLDILGETVRTTEEAEHGELIHLEMISALAQAAKDWPQNDQTDVAPFGILPTVNVSVKLSALSPDFSHDIAELDLGEVYRRLAVICRAARKHGVAINIDLEHDSLRAATFDIFKRLLSEPDLRDWADAGIVIQAYLRESRRDLDDLLAFSRRRGVPLAIRLVKGAYWDYETNLAAKHGRPSPVWSQKWQSDANYEALSRVLIENCDQLRPAFGSHNVRSIAHAIAAADSRGLPPRTIELQALFGMGDPLKTALVKMQQRLRVYSPMGAWVPGVAYLVRRLLENTANESFLRQSFLENADEDQLLLRPEQSIAIRGAE